MTMMRSSRSVTTKGFLVENEKFSRIRLQVSPYIPSQATYLYWASNKLWIFFAPSPTSPLVPTQPPLAARNPAASAVILIGDVNLSTTLGRTKGFGEGYGCFSCRRRLRWRVCCFFLRRYSCCEAVLVEGCLAPSSKFEVVGLWNIVETGGLSGTE